MGKKYESYKGVVITLGEVKNGMVKVLAPDGHVWQAFGAVVLGNYLSAASWTRAVA